MPKTLTAAAIRCLADIRASKESYERGDEVWVAFDRDDHDDVAGCLARCRDAEVGFAFSNPCVEQWAIIHFQDPVSDAPLTRQQAQARLCELMPGYDKDGAKRFDFTTLKHRYDLACSNARILMHRREQEGAPYNAPLTTFHLLTARIKELGIEDLARLK